MACQLLERPQAWYTIFGVKQFFFRIFSPAVAAIFRRCSPQGRVAEGDDRGPPLSAIVAVNVAECPFWVNCGGAGSLALRQLKLNKRT